MKKQSIWQAALLQAILAGAYIALIATFLNNAKYIFGTAVKPGTIGGILFLLIFVISAALMGILVFGRSVLWYLDGKKGEAVYLALSTVGFLILITVVILIIVISYRGPIATSPEDATYLIQGKSITLKNGKAELPIAPGSATKEKISLFGEPLYADLDNDGDKDAVDFLTVDSGGSGTFYYVVVAVNDNGLYLGTDAMFLGDRIAPQNINFIDGRAVVNYADRKPGEAFSVKPSVGKSIWLHLDAANRQIGEYVKNFEGESK